MTDQSHATTHGHALAPHNISYKPYRADFADATRAVLRLVERHSRHSTTALNRQSLSALFLSLALPLSPASPLFRARSLAVVTAFYFRARSARLAATQGDATRRGATRDARSPRSGFISLSTLFSPYRARVSFRESLSVYRRVLSLLPARHNPPVVAITRRNPLPCRLRPALCWRARVVVRIRSLSALPSCAAHTAPVPGNSSSMQKWESRRGVSPRSLLRFKKSALRTRMTTMISTVPSMHERNSFRDVPLPDLSTEVTL